ncbi:hypothetical protein [Paenibacillus sp. 2TAB19]|uniref:hypothetical protein n=1 Tax=Paenibacillus sp. 2TAB19 TaxID=3233003 RepID=UPI003F972D0F
MMKQFVLLFMVATVLSACGQVQSNTEEQPVIAESAEFAGAPRAVGQGEYGELHVLPLTEDGGVTESLGAPSCLGEETDYISSGDYDVVFKRTDGTETSVGSLSDTQIVSEGGSDQPRKLGSLASEGVELYYFQPIQNKCRADAVYVYVVSEDDAYQASFEVEGQLLDQFSLAPESEPYIEAGQLVLESTEDEQQEYTYMFMLENKKLRLVKKEERGD